MIEDSIAILCRGESLKDISILPEVEEYIIINGFSDELEMDFIKDVLSGKKITHVLSLGSLSHPHPSGAPNGCFGAMIQKDHFKKFNVERFILPYIKECLPGDANNPVIHTIKNSKDEYIPVYGLNDDNKKYMMKDHPRYKFTYPSCGMGSIGFATVDLGKKNVYIIGMDFYEKSGYLAENVEYDVIMRRCAAEGKQLKEFLPGFVSQHPDVKFNMYTYANLSSTLKNFKINILKNSRN